MDWQNLDFSNSETPPRSLSQAERWMTFTAWTDNRLSQAMQTLITGLAHELSRPDSDLVRRITDEVVSKVSDQVTTKVTAALTEEVRRLMKDVVYAVNGQSNSLTSVTSDPNQLPLF